MSANVQKVDDDGTGVATATAIVWSKVRPVLVMSRTTCVSPCTQGYGIFSRVRPRCDSVVDDSAVKFQNASSTTTCAMVDASGPSLRTSTVMPSLASVTRWNASFSTGG